MNVGMSETRPLLDLAVEPLGIAKGLYQTDDRRCCSDAKFTCSASGTLRGMPRITRTANVPPTESLLILS
jgi:hypothetical protein